MCKRHSQGFIEQMNDAEVGDSSCVSDSLPLATIKARWHRQHDFVEVAWSQPRDSDQLTQEERQDELRGMTASMDPDPQITVFRLAQLV